MPASPSPPPRLLPCVPQVTCLRRPRPARQPRADGGSSASSSSLIILLVSLRSLAGLYTDSLWFSSVDLHNVFSTLLAIKLGLFGVFGAIFFAVLWVNLVVCDRIAGHDIVAGPGGRAGAALPAVRAALRRAHLRRRGLRPGPDRGSGTSGSGTTGSCSATAARSASPTPSSTRTSASTSSRSRSSSSSWTGRWSS